MDAHQKELYEEILRLKEENAFLKHSLESNPYKRLFESSPDIIIQVDRQYRIIILHAPGRDDAELLKGKDVFSVVPKAVHEQMRGILDEIFVTGNIVKYESELDVDGIYKYFDNHVSPIRSSTGEIESVYYLSREITAQKVSDQFNVESRRKLHALFENSHHILTLLDTDCNIIWFNKRANEHHTRFGKPMIVGASAENYFAGERLTFFRTNIQRVLKGEVIVYNIEFVWADRPHYLEVCLEAVYEGDNIIAISLASTDVTDRRIYEEKLKSINYELVQQNEQLNQYSYIISHNLRAPIVTLLGLVSIVNQATNDPEETQTILSHIHKSAHHLDTVIRDLNMVLSINDKTTLMSSISLDEEFDIVQFLLKDQIEKSFAVIDLDFKQCPSIVSIKSYIHNIMYNLLSNALKYKKTHVAPHIKISSYKTEEGMVCIEFADNGIGVDLHAFRDKLFGFYKRFHTHVEGKGLGLHLVKKQIDRLEGRIEVESVVNQGTTFKVLLPE